MASAVNALAGASTSVTLQPAAAMPAPSQQMFLQLLVAQIKNQDPMSPADPTQFTSQLAQFSELEQIIAIRGDLEKGQSVAGTAAAPNVPAAPAADNTGTPTGTAPVDNTAGTTNPAS